MTRVHKDLEQLLNKAKAKGIPKTQASKQLADFATRNNFEPMPRLKRWGRPPRICGGIRKGTPLDLIGIMVGLFSFSLAVILVYTMLVNMQASGGLSTTSQSAYIINSEIQNWVVFDNLFLAALLGLSLTSIIAAAKVRTSPLFLFLSLILLAIILVIGAVLTNTWEQFVDSSAIVATASVLPKMHYIMENFLMYLLVEGAMILIALYSTRGSSYAQ